MDAKVAFLPGPGTGVTHADPKPIQADPNPIPIRQS